LGAGVRSYEVPNHSLVTSFPSTRLALEESECIIIERKRYFRLRPAFAGELVK
jgi:hypothetical protein